MFRWQPRQHRPHHQSELSQLWLARHYFLNNGAYPSSGSGSPSCRRRMSSRSSPSRRATPRRSERVASSTDSAYSTSVIAVALSPVSPTSSSGVPVPTEPSCPDGTPCSRPYPRGSPISRRSGRSAYSTAGASSGHLRRISIHFHRSPGPGGKAGNPSYRRVTAAGARISPQAPSPSPTGGEVERPDESLEASRYVFQCEPRERVTKSPQSYGHPLSDSTVNILPREKIPQQYSPTAAGKTAVFAPAALPFPGISPAL